jgi:hypothetical protein
MFHPSVESAGRHPRIRNHLEGEIRLNRDSAMLFILSIIFMAASLLILPDSVPLATQLTSDFSFEVRRLP